MFRYCSNRLNNLFAFTVVQAAAAIVSLAGAIAEENAFTSATTTTTATAAAVTSIEEGLLEFDLDQDENDNNLLQENYEATSTTTTTSNESSRSIQRERHFLRRTLQKEVLDETTELTQKPLEYTNQYFIEKEKFGSCLYPNLDEAHRLASLYEQSPYLESLSKPIINLGMPRCGSTSLYTFFECSDKYRTSHYFCDNDTTNDSVIETGELDNNFQSRQRCGTCMKDSAKQDLPVIDNCGTYDVYTQIDTEGLDECVFPQITYLKEIHDNYPNATFILPFRDIDHWIKSIYNFQLKKTKLYWNTKKLYHPTLKDILSNCHIEPLLPKGYGTRNDELIQFICQHVTNVRNFVKEHPSHTLIEINIEGKHTGNILSKLFNIDSKCWHHVNYNTEVVEEKSLTRDILVKDGEIIYT